MVNRNTLESHTVGTYYLDIETTGLEPESSKIITIQYQELERNTGIPKGSLIILKEWEIGESGMIRRFIENTPIVNGRKFDFIPVGYNLNFEQKFLRKRPAEHGLAELNITDRPMLDLHVTGVIMNNCEFGGSGLDRMTGKAQSGSEIGQWYEEKDYDRITNYIKDETKEFLKFFAWMCKELPYCTRDSVISMAMGLINSQAQHTDGLLGKEVCN